MENPSTKNPGIGNASYSVFGRLSVDGDSRTALPQIPDNALIVWTVTAKKSGSDDVVSVATADAQSGSWHYELNLPAPGEWGIGAEGSYNSVACFSGSTTISVSEENPAVSANIRASPVTVGDGSVSLSIKISDPKINFVQYKFGTGAVETLPITTEGGLRVVKINLASVPNGVYMAHFYFYTNSSPAQRALLYSCTEAVNVLSGLSTSSWSGSGLHITSGSFDVTTLCTSAFSHREFFVDAVTGNDDENTGTKYDPFQSVQRAVNVISEVQDGGAYTINLVTDVSGPGGYMNTTSTMCAFVSVPSTMQDLTIKSADATPKTLDAGCSAERAGRVIYFSGKKTYASKHKN